MTINKEALETLVRTHGILLEHRTTLLIEEYLRQLNNEKVFCKNIEYSSGQHHYSKLMQTYLEIDSLFNFVTTYEYLRVKSSNLRARGLATPDEISLPNQDILTSVVVECKGHASSGFLLVRSAAPRLGEKQNNFESTQALQIYTGNRLAQATIHQKNIYLSDWACFYKVSGNDQKTSVKNKGGGKARSNDADIPKYCEDKEKFYKAEKQIHSSLNYAIEDYASSKYINRHGAFRAIPLIVTNAPIYTMTLENPSVRFYETPWTTYLSQHRQDGFSELSLPFHRYIYVVNFKYLKPFLDCLLMKDEFVLPNEFTLEEAHSFDIEILTDSIDEEQD